MRRGCKCLVNRANCFYMPTYISSLRGGSELCSLPLVDAASFLFSLSERTKKVLDAPFL